MEAAYDDTMRKTSFAPQEPQRDVQRRLDQKRLENLDLQTELQDMIDMKSHMRRMHREQKLADDNELIRQT